MANQAIEPGRTIAVYYRTPAKSGKAQILAHIRTRPKPESKTT